MTKFKIYRKPTATDHIIPSDSNHPPVHKMSVIRYLTNWLITYPLNILDRNKEHETIKYILYNNKYNPQLLDRTISIINTKLHTQQETHTTPTKHKIIIYTSLHVHTYKTHHINYIYIITD